MTASQQAQAQAQMRGILPGEPAPHFFCATQSNPRYAFSTVAGRYIVMLFFGSTTHPDSEGALKAVRQHRILFDDNKFCFFGVSIDPRDEKSPLTQEQVPGVRCFRDYDGAVSAQFGALDAPLAEMQSSGQPVSYRPFFALFDPQLRLLGTIPANEPAKLFDMMAILPPPAQHAGVEVTAPVLILPRIFEPEFCKKLINLYETQGGEESGFMREIDGVTRRLIDHSHKRRSDYSIEDQELCAQARVRVMRRLIPEITRAFQYKPTRMERYIVACYDSGVGGYFRPHRDNTTKGTAHRRFAVSINLNAEEFEGGNLRFPEYGDRTYRPPTGGAVVFSCSLLHEATPVTKGTRYAFLPFLYDEEGAKIREANNKFVDPEVGVYKSGKSETDSDSTKASA